MSEADPAALVDIMQKDAWSLEDYEDLCSLCHELPDSVDKLRAALGQLQRENPEPKGAAALKIGISRYLLARYGDALDVLSDATDNKERRYFQGACLQQAGRHEQAIEEYERAKARGWPEPGIDFKIAEVRALAGQTDEAEKALSDLSADDEPGYHYVEGLVKEIQGYREDAADRYEKAIEIDEDYGPAVFRLAYFLDLHGHEDQAIELYRKCLSKPPVYANALLNLAVLYEDAGHYDRAAECLRRILAANPNHQRAQLFLKDVEASKTMFFDEDQARRVAKRNAVLDIPVTDFELSVRARNCLKKMNIHTLGDLIRTTEAELLAYKNFGETSLKEIKDMLAAKGLRLGQALEEGTDIDQAVEAMTSGPSADEKVLNTPIEQVELSVRARRAIENLGIRTLGDLADKTEVELMSCKNFGQTSLNEVRQRLNEYGLSLREAK